MNILHVIPAFYPAEIYGGPIESVHQLCRHLSQIGCNVTVLTTDANGENDVLDVGYSKEIELEPHLNVRYCHRIYRHTISPALIKLLPDYIRKADVIHLTSVYSFPTIPTLLMCKLLGKPVVWSPRGSFQSWEGSRRLRAKFLWEQICKIAAPTSLILHTTSDQESRSTEKHISGAHVAVIPNGVTVPEVVTRVAGNGSIRLLYLGRLHPIKGIENLLKACRILNANQNYAWSLAIAGGGESEYVRGLRGLIGEFSLRDQVTLLGEIRGQVKQNLFQQNDALVLPSFSENFGLVVAEALAHGVPVIAGTGTPWKQVEEIGCGRWVSNDPVSLAEAITNLQSMDLREMGDRGRAWMLHEFSWVNRAQEMFECYGALCRTA